jgi:hypothetical protein
MLQNNGHVIMPKLKFDLEKAPKLQFSSVGRNNATTFTGLCANHDSEIFAPIENSKIDLENDLHLFLLAYRAVLKETNACMEGAIKNQLAYQSKVGLGLIPGDQPTTDGMRTTNLIINGYDTYLYKKVFDELYLKKEYKRIHHLIKYIKQDSPSLAVNSLFTFSDNINDPKEPQRIILNIFPSINCTNVIFSFLHYNEWLTPNFIKEIMDAKDTRCRFLISQLVLNSCENFVVAPKFFKTISPNKKEAMLEYIQATLNNDKLDNENNSFLLFY